METDEIYEVLMLQLLQAINRYDPDYTLKVKLLTEAINIITHDSALKQFNVPDFRDHLDFDCYLHLRMLARNSFIEQILEDGEPAGWVIRSENWPPPKSFHRVGPIGLAYYLQTWFRYNLRERVKYSIYPLSTRLWSGIPESPFDPSLASSLRRKEGGKYFGFLAMRTEALWRRKGEYYRIEPLLRWGPIQS